MTISVIDQAPCQHRDIENSSNSDFSPPSLSSTSVEEDVRIISDQGTGCIVREHDASYITKQGYRVRHSEEVATNLVRQHTDVPVPYIFYAIYNGDYGHLGMTIIPGSPLQLSWSTLEADTKEHICREIWEMVTKWRQIPKPAELSHVFQCLADGSPTNDRLIVDDLEDPPRDLVDDDALRARIVERYAFYNGRRYANELPDMLPRSSRSVFTHADLAPRNIMVDQNHHITGILDWERAGWYPDYWEYANVMGPACKLGDWQEWVDRTAPRKWDISGIQAARRVLF